MSHWYSKQRSDYRQTYEHRDKSAAHNNLPLRSGDDGAEYSGKRAERGNATDAIVLVFDRVRCSARLVNPALVLLIRWNGWSDTKSRVMVASVLRTADNCSGRLELRASRLMRFVIGNCGD